VLPAVCAGSARLLALCHVVSETAGSLGGSSDSAGESHRPVRVLASASEWWALTIVVVWVSDPAGTSLHRCHWWANLYLSGAAAGGGLWD
jgi:hypothetical protein